MNSLLIHKNADFSATWTDIKDIHAWYIKIEGSLGTENMELTNQWLLQRLDEEEISADKPLNLIFDTYTVSDTRIRSLRTKSSQKLLKYSPLFWIVLIEAQDMHTALSIGLAFQILIGSSRFRKFKSYEKARSFLQSKKNPFYESHSQEEKS